MTDRGAALLALAVMAHAVALWAALTNTAPRYVIDGPSSAVLLEERSGRTWLFSQNGWRPLEGNEP